MKKRLKKCISLVLAVILFIGTFPAYALADEGAEKTVRPTEPEELLCRFLCEEIQAEVTVYAQDGTPVPVGEDGLHHLARGSYFYSAEAEGYASIDMCPFIVPADAEGDQELRISMTKLDEPAAEQAAKPEPGVGGAPSRTNSAIRVGLFAARFGMYQVFDVQRSPTYPGGTQKSPNPFKVRELSVPLDMDNLSEEDYFYFAGIGPASVTGIRCADGWNAAAQDLDPYTVALHFVKGKTDLELSRGMIGALSNKGFLYEAGGKCLWFSNEKGYYYASVGITYTPVEDGRLVCDENLLNTYKGQSMLKPAADAPRHTHVWSTEAEGNEAVFTCEAADCPYGEEHVFTMTLSVPAFVRLGASAEATLEKSEEDADWPEELEQNVITYIGRDGTDYPRSMKAPTGEGSYTAEVSVGYRKDARVLKADFAIVSGELKDFNKTLSADGVIVTVKAEAGVLPADAALSVTRADMDALKSTLAAVNGTREPAWLCGIAITLLDKDGNRIAPADGHSVSVSLALTEAADENLETRIFRMTTDETGALTAEEQNVNAFGGTGADAETDGSLLYVVELMRPVLHYGLTDTDTPLDELLAAVGLSGSAGNVSVSDSGVLGITGKDGARSLTILRSFTDLEWLRVTIRNVTYEISLTDETPSAACLRSGGHTWCEDNGHDPISCIVCGELQAIAEGLDFELEFDGDRWLHVGDGVTDIENYTLWDEMFRDMELSGDWAADLIRVAQTQLGYRESTANYTVSTHRERNGYTRYGAWYGIPYGEWCAMFLSFCLHYAGIEDDDMPYQSGCEAWIEALTERGMYTAEKGFRPQAGDLVFFDTDDDGKADHVALIREYNGNTGVLYTIEGNLDDEVGTREIGILDETILGYGLLPENKSSARRMQAVDVSDHPLVEVGASDDEPLLALDRLNPRTIALLGLSAAHGRRLMAMRAAPGTQGSDDIPTEGPVDADGMTIEKVSVKWLSKSTGEDEPAGKGTLALSADTNTVGNQQFQLDFALSGKDDHEPGTVEIIFPAYIQNMTATVSYGEPTISDDGTQVPARPPQFENKTRPGSLQIMKAATGLTSANKDAVFTFKVRLSNDAGMPLTESGQMFWYAKPVEKADESPVTENTEPPAEPEDSVPDPEPVSPSPAPGMRTRNAVMKAALRAPAKAPALTASSGTSIVIPTGTPTGSKTAGTNVTIDWYSDSKTIVIRKTNPAASATITGSSLSSALSSYLGSAQNVISIDTISVTGSMANMFKGRTNIKKMDLNSLDVSAVTSLERTFYEMKGLEELAVDQWNVANVSNFWVTFGYLNSLKVLNISGWSDNNASSSSGSGFQAFIYDCKVLEYIDARNLKIRANTNIWAAITNHPNLAAITVGPEFRFTTSGYNSGDSSSNHGIFNGGSVSKYFVGDTWYRMGIDDPEDAIGTEALRLKVLQDAAGTWIRKGHSTIFTDYTIQFDPNGGTGSMDPITGNIAEPAILPDCTFENDLIFDGWSTDPEAARGDYQPGEEFTGSAPGGQPITLYTIWKSENSFLINYDANGGYTATQWQRVNDPEGSVTMPVPTHPSGYEFLYWTTDPEGDGERFNGTVPGTSFHAQPGDTVKLYAQYLDPSKRGQVTVEHYQQNPDGSGYALYEKDLLGAFQIDEKVTPVKKTYVGFVPPTEFQVFAGASTTGTTQDDGTEITVVRGGVVVRYYYDRTHYNLAFDANGGEGEMDEAEMTGGVPAKLPVNRFTKDNSVFVGWNTQPDGTGVNYGDGQSVNSIADSGTVTLYAQWFSLDDGQSAEPTNGEYTVTCKANEVIVFPTLPAGTHYEVVEVDLPEGWSLTGIDNGSGTVLSAERVNVKATNAYSAYGTADLLARKSLPGESFNPGDFSFELVDESGTVLQTVANSRVDENEQISGEDEETIPNPNYGTAPVYFDTIRYEQPGDYRYTIREKVGNNMAIRYDTHEEQVIVHVTDRGDGRLVTQVIYDASGASFRNGMSTGDLTVSKTITNATEAAAEKSFSFTLYLFDSAGVEIGESYPYTVSDGRTGQIRSGGVITMKGGESFSVTGLPHKSSYIVTETPADGFELVATEKPEGTVIAGETVQASFENAYTSRTDEADGGAVIEARKAYEHGVLEDDLFQFRLLDENEEEVDTAYAKADGSITFAPLHYTLADDGKKYLYYIEEVPGDDPNVIYDDHRERVLVSVSDNGDGTMTAEVEYPGRTGDTATLPPLFTNKREDGSLVISKELLEYEGSEPATFVFRIEGELDGKKVISTVKTLTFTGKGSDSVTVEKIPVGTVVTVTEEYTGARFKLDSAAAQEAQIPAPEDGPAAVSFSNRYDNTVDGGHGILNTFGAKPNPDFDPLDPDSPRYIWDGWTKTP